MQWGMFTLTNDEARAKARTAAATGRRSEHGRPNGRHCATAAYSPIATAGFRRSAHTATYRRWLLDVGPVTHYRQGILSTGTYPRISAGF